MLHDAELRILSFGGGRAGRREDEVARGARFGPRVRPARARGEPTDSAGPLDASTPAALDASSRACRAGPRPDPNLSRALEIHFEPIDKVDILFVVDDSSTMADEQAQLADSFAQLVDTLFATSVRFPTSVR